MSISEKDISVPIDTITVCKRNTISDVTFYDSTNIVKEIVITNFTRFPFHYIEKNKEREVKEREALLKHLKDGKELPVRPFHDDWIIFVILGVAFLYFLIRTFSKKLFPEMTRFFFFRGVGEIASRDTGELFHWQSTILNLISFFSLALFSYYFAFYYAFIPAGLSGIIFWLLALGIIIVAVTARHILCFITGNISGENEAFSEYLITVYQSYRYMALISLLIIILLSYTLVLPAKSLIITGAFSMGILYLMRLIRLALIFIKRKISILYLILYLCALEFLPVLIALKYFTGLF